jgi:hypothetical protein
MTMSVVEPMVERNHKLENLAIMLSECLKSYYLSYQMIASSFARNDLERSEIKKKRIRN